MVHLLRVITKNAERKEVVVWDKKYHSDRKFVGVLTSGMLTSGAGLRVNSSLTTSVFPS